MIQFVSYLHFFCAVVYFLLIGFVLFLNPRSILNRSCAMLLFCFFLWSFGMAFVHNHYVSAEQAAFFENICSLGWVNFSGVFLLFSAILTERKKIIPHILVFISVNQGMLLWLQWSNNLLYNYSLHYYGWIGVWSKTTSPYYFCYYVLTMSIGLYFIYNYQKETDNPLKKRLAYTLIAAAISPLILGTLSNIVLREFGFYNLPPLADVFTILWVSGMIYAMYRYRFLRITPAIAADNIVSTMTDCLLLLDSFSRIVYVNRYTVELLNFTVEELEGKPLSVILDDDADCPGQKACLLKGEANSLCETNFKTKKGGLIPVSVRCSILPGAGFVCVARDITMHRSIKEALERAKNELEDKVRDRTRELGETNRQLEQRILDLKNAKAALVASEERFKLIFEYAPDGMYLTDMNGVFLDGNRQAEEIVGYSRNELIGTTFKEAGILSDAEVPKVVALLEKNKAGQGTGPEEFCMRHKNGRNVYVEISAYPVTIHNTDLILGLARDITVRKQEEHERQKIVERTHQSQKLESIGQLAGGIAHDFNNLLVAIAMYAEIIKNNVKNDAGKVVKSAEKIVMITRRASDLVGNLLTFARKGKQERVQIDLHAILNDVVDILEHTLNKNILITQSLLAETSSVFVDKSQIQNAILNMALNSRDAMPDGGKLTFITETVTVDQTFINTYSSQMNPGRYLSLSVQDTGIGMDESTRKRIFEPFFTTKEAGKGTGLGLSSVYGIILRHNGHITIESEPGKGTTFRLYFPLADKVIPSAHETVPPVPAQRGGGSIMLVDDEESVRESAEELLSDLNYRVIPCVNGVEAVEFYRKGYREVDCVLLDMNMPQMSGYECFLKLKEINPDAKVILFSGYAQEEEVARALTQGALYFVQKPFDWDELALLLAEVVQGK